MYISVPPPGYITDLPPTVVPSAVMLACVIAYQVASYPTGYMFAALGWVKPIMEKGSPRNLTAADLLNAHKPLLAFLTLFLDLIKGPFATCAGIAFGALFLKSYIVAPSGEHVCIPELSLYMLFLPPIAALLGDVFPLWLRFKGGKGFTAAFGIYFFMNPQAGFVTLAIWLAVFALTRTLSLAAIISMISCPAWAWVFRKDVWLELPDVTGHFALMAIVLALIVLYGHKDSIRRLRNGTEPKWERGAPASPSAGVS